ncbi:uncharacterized protein BXZ73DRAFT_59173, partial [Epithele typhae]|uniref:uncharacterized protein n=1 Tax=Epithele typhae TaxID=378194 RepID=UPI002007EB43
DVFQRTTQDESLFPPKCCRIPLEFAAVQKHLPLPLCERYADKRREYTTSDRVYCHTPTCSAFLGPRQKAAAPAARGLMNILFRITFWPLILFLRLFIFTKTVVAYTCANCGARTCARCKLRAHTEGRTCPAVDTERVLAIGRARGWKRCPACGHLIELIAGCSCVRCPCWQNFCYRCGAPWGTCRCHLPYWNVGQPQF